MKKNIFQTFEDNWPEDEAYSVYMTFKEACEDCPEETEFYRECMAKDIEHMHKCFSKHEDAATLIERFNKKLNSYNP